MIEQFKSSEVYQKLKGMQVIKKQIEKVDSATTEIQFHIERFESMKKEFREKKETVMNQEQLIINLADSIKRYT